MVQKIKKIIDEENEFWSEVFDKELRKNDKKKYSSYWWEEYYSEIKSYMHNILIDYKNPSILEAGAGSGKASLILGKDIDRTLLDISKSALEYSKVLTQEYNCKNVKYIEGNIFNLKLNKKFDIVWNIGVLEHYDERDIVVILKEMIKITKVNGKVLFGVPNIKSGPIIKAKLLTKPLLRKFPGYKLGSEKFYSEKKLIDLTKRAFNELDQNFENIELVYFGNPLIMETPKWIIKTIGRVVSSFFIKRKFLIMIKVDKM